MRRTSGLNIVEVVIVAAVVTVLFAVLMPVFMRDKHNSQYHHCQSNMNHIGKALKMYLADWENTFPINGSRNKYAPVVHLSNPSKTDRRGDLVKFEHGVNWVEALSPYVAKVSEGDAAAAWKCPASRAKRVGSAFAAVTYAFNANLIGRPEGVVKNAGSLMVAREMDCMYDSVLRPANVSTGPESAPVDAFLDPDETGSRDPKYKLHGDGSNLLFVDGHVKTFNIAYFPKTCEWDSADKQWYNYVKLPESDPRNKSIAVSP